MNKSIKKQLTFSGKTFQVASMAVYLLGGAIRHVDTEDVAVKAFSLAPAMFGWQKYPQFPNLELVRVALSDAKKRKNGGLLSGSGREGWRLTTNGLDWASSEESKTEPATKNRPGTRRSAGSIDTVRKNREMARLHESSAWKLWTQRMSISHQAAKELFRIDDYSSPKLIEGKIVRMQAMFQDIPELNRFLRAASKVILNTEVTL